MSVEQRACVNSWLGEVRVIADHSWGQTDTVVIEVESQAARFIVKAGGEKNGHIAREIRAHRRWTGPWVSKGHAARLIGADEAARVLVTTYLPGILVEGSSAQQDPDMYRQAGTRLADFHSQQQVFDLQWNDNLRKRVLRFLDMPHRIASETVKRVRSELAGWPTGGAMTVPTHGDWQPRNWLNDGGVLRVIDLGRFDFRVPEEDFVRLGRQDFLSDPALEAAFLDGYGSDPRDRGMWRRMNVAEAVGTAAWAFMVGDQAFEAVGHSHLARLYTA
ncbi:aminoglycoside phosphotransferase [Williamsia sp. 1138]|nr:aminoglycoside phosphotransferase [Williamsia sp. 1138]